jgi:hypothetical protein
LSLWRASSHKGKNKGDSKPSWNGGTNAWAIQLRQPKKHKPSGVCVSAEKCKESKETLYLSFYLFRSTFFFSLKQQRATNTKKWTIIKHQSKIANSTLQKLLYPTIFSLFYLLVFVDRNPATRTQQNIYSRSHE